MGVGSNAELCMSIGDAYFECNQWDEALDLYHDLTENDSMNNSILWHKIGRCYRNLGTLESALECFEAVTETDPLDLVARTQLAELYEQLGYRQKALDMVNNLIELRRKARESGIALDNDSIFIGTSHSNPSQAKTGNTLALRTPTSRSIAERRLDEELRAQKYVKTREKLETISSKLATDQFSDDLFLMTEYVRLATPLVEGFRQTPALFPYALGSKFDGINSIVPRSNKRTESANPIKSTVQSEEIDQPATCQEFRGIGFTDWVRIFVYYGFSCAKIERADEGCEVLGHVMRAPTFRQSASMQQVLRLAYAACCYASQNFVEVIDTIRWLSRRLLFHNDPVRLIAALLSRGFQASVAFFNTNTQKWLLRQLQLIDGRVGDLRLRLCPNQENLEGSQQGKDGPSSTSNTRISEAHLRKKNRIEMDVMRDENEVDDEDDSYWKPSKFKPTKPSPVFGVTFAQILSGTRSFKSAIIYYLRIYETYPNEPLLNLLLAITYVQRAMQRQTDNRHHQIVQALAFLDHYRELRPTAFAQEVEFNLGRLFHGLGLTSLAVTHYNRVLSLASSVDRTSSDSSENQPTDLSGLAAYNLVLIYSTSGSPDLAHRLICQYLTV